MSSLLLFVISHQTQLPKQEGDDRDEATVYNIESGNMREHKTNKNGN